MKLLTLLASLTTITLSLQLNSPTSLRTSALLPRSPPSGTPPPDSPPDSYIDPDDAIWLRAHCRGSLLLRAMTLSEDGSSDLLSWPYTQSPFDGDLKAELRTWGYLDDDTIHGQSDAQCDFDSWHHVKRAFAALGVDTRSKSMGGENHCFFVRHADGPAVIKAQDGTLGPPEEQRYIVHGKTYRITNAYSRIGINRKAGIVYFLHRKSPEHAAEELWGLDPDTTPDSAELPKIRASSDLAWGLWNRVPGEDVKHLTMFMAFGIVNDDTASVIIPRALQAAGVDEVDKWPGTDFVVGEGGAEMEEAAMALIGSPNGLGAGYFLLQHKRQLGAAKSIRKVKVFKGDDEFDSEDPNIIFYVDAAPPSMKRAEEPSAGLETDKPVLNNEVHREDGWSEAKIVKRGNDGKAEIRERVWTVKL